MYSQKPRGKSSEVYYSRCNTGHLHGLVRWTASQVPAASRTGWLVIDTISNASIFQYFDDAYSSCNRNGYSDYAVE